MKKLVFLIFLVGLLSCEGDKIESIDCESFYIACSTLDENAVKTELEKLTVDLNPAVMSEDPIGHLRNMETLIDRLNENCDTYTARINCYACNIETFPIQSEILIEFEGNQKFIISLHTPENDILRFAGVSRP